MWLHQYENKLISLEENIIMDKLEHYIRIHQEDITNLNVYAPKSRASKYMK